MSAKTEKENIAKIERLIEQIEDLKANEQLLYEEIIALLRKRYPSSDRFDINAFKTSLNLAMGVHGDFNRVKAYLMEDMIIFPSHFIEQSKVKNIDN